MRWSLMFLMGTAACAAASLATAADSFTVGVLSCAAETDRDRRLECYDRAVAAFTAGLSSGKREPTASLTPPAPVASESTPASGRGAKLTAPPPDATAGSAAPSAERHVSAHIASIDHFPDYVVVHL